MRITWRLGVKDSGSDEKVMATENQGQTSFAMPVELANGTTRRQGVSCLSDLCLDQLALGELTGVQEDIARLHISQCRPCEVASKRLAAARAQFEADVNVPNMAARLMAEADAMRRPSRFRPWVRLLAWPATVSAAAALALVSLAPSLTAVSPETTMGARAKGPGLALSTYVKFAGQDQPGTLHMGQPLGAGDRLQFRVSTTRAGHLAILSLGARGEVSVFYPPGAQTAEVPAGRDQPLGTAVELDDSPDPETVVALLCDKPLLIAKLVTEFTAHADNAGHQAAPPITNNCAEARTTLTKKVYDRP